LRTKTNFPSQNAIVELTAVLFLPSSFSAFFFLLRLMNSTTLCSLQKSVAEGKWDNHVWTEFMRECLPSKKEANEFREHPVEFLQSRGLSFKKNVIRLAFGGEEEDIDILPLLKQQVKQLCQEFSFSLK
jgi:hypothetical protein